MLTNKKLSYGALFNQAKQYKKMKKLNQSETLEFNTISLLKIRLNKKNSFKIIFLFKPKLSFP